MRDHERSLGTRVGRGLIFTIGLLGGFVVVDAVLLFFFSLLVAMFVETPNPYLGAVLAVGLPMVAVVGAGLAWIAYAVLNNHGPQSKAGEHHIRV